MRIINQPALFALLAGGARSAFSLAAAADEDSRARQRHHRTILPADNDICPAAEAGRTTTDTAGRTCIIDLAQPYVDNEFQTEDGKALIALAEGDDDVHAFIALECGKVVAEYYDSDSAETKLFHLFSATKSWSSLLFGVMEKVGLISFNETLWDIWPNETVWANVDDEEDRKNTTIEQLLQMTGGFDMKDGWQQDMLIDVLPFNDNRGGGKDFETSLTYHTLDTNTTGTYKYLPAGNLISYITYERTGKTPVEYAEETVFPYLGIEEGDYDWYQNLEAVSLGFHGLKLTANALSKIAMLYLQQGMANENDEIVTPDFIERSFTNGDPSNVADPFGYLAWWTGGEPAYCTYGFGGQRACVNYETSRAFAILSQTYYIETGIEELEDPTKPTPTDQVMQKFMFATADEISYPNACADAPPSNMTKPDPEAPPSNMTKPDPEAPPSNMTKPDPDAPPSNMTKPDPNQPSTPRDLPLSSGSRLEAFWITNYVRLGTCLFVAIMI